MTRNLQNQEPPVPPSPDPAHTPPDEDQPNPGDPGPPVPHPRPAVDPLGSLPLDEAPPRGV